MIAPANLAPDDARLTVMSAGTAPLTVGARLALAMKGGKVIVPTAKQLEKFRKQLQDHGPKSLQRSLNKIERRLNEYVEKLSEIKKSGGHASSVEREIRNFEREIAAIKQISGGSN